MQLLACAVILAAGMVQCRAQSPWERKVNEELPRLGHRNWIAVVDSAYPLQSAPGIETVETGADQMTVLKYVIRALHESPHVRPIAHTDMELKYVTEADAVGVNRYREQVNQDLAIFPNKAERHGDIIAQLKDVATRFQV